MSAAKLFKDRELTNLALWEKLRFYLRFFELLTSVVISSLIFKSLDASRYPDELTLNSGPTFIIRLRYHYLLLVTGVITLSYSFVSMLQTLSQGQQYNLPKWLVYAYLTLDGLLVLLWTISCALMFSERSDKKSSWLSLSEVACLLGRAYSLDWKFETPDAVDYPLICTFSSVAGTLGWFVFCAFLLSLALTLYLRFKWGKLRV